MWRTAFRMTGDRESADDLTQEACLKAYRAFDDFKPGTNYRAWIFRILVNLCLDDARRNKRSPIVDTEIEALSIRWLSTSKDESPEARLARKRIREAVRRAMEELSPELRVIVSLALLEERNYQEIAESLGKPVDALRQLHRRPCRRS